MYKILKVAFPAGIGDTLWIMTKMQALLRQEGCDKVAISICSDPLRRAGDFLSAFSFVESVDYVEYGILDEPITNKDGSYNYTNSQRNWHNRFDWFLQMNGHLERGNRLEEWFPELETNWGIFDEFNWRFDDVQFAKEQCDYCCFYFGPEAGNTIEGHNKGPMWTPENWLALQHYCSSIGLKVIGLGASYDRSYIENQLLPIGFECDDQIGKLPIGRTLALVANAKFLIGYQSGITISAAFLGTRGGGFWRPYGNSISRSRFLSFSNSMASAWVPPEMLKSGNWLPLIYGRDTPTSISKYIGSRWL